MKNSKYHIFYQQITTLLSLLTNLILKISHNSLYIYTYIFICDKNKRYPVLYKITQIIATRINRPRFVRNKTPVFRSSTKFETRRANSYSLMIHARAFRLGTNATICCRRDKAVRATPSTARWDEEGEKEGNGRQLFSRERSERRGRKTINLDPNYRVVQRL